VWLYCLNFSATSYFLGRRPFFVAASYTKCACIMCKITADVFRLCVNKPVSEVVPTLRPPQRHLALLQVLRRQSCPRNKLGQSRAGSGTPISWSLLQQTSKLPCNRKRLREAVSFPVQALPHHLEISQPRSTAGLEDLQLARLMAVLQTSLA